MTTATRRRLPNRRDTENFKLTIGGHKLFIHVARFKDGSPAEVWIDSSKDGTTLRGFMADFAKLVSIALQSGVPLATLSRAFRGVEYPPCGPVEGHETIESATSVPDLLFQALAALSREVTDV